MCDQEGPQGGQVDELGGHPVIKAHAADPPTVLRSPT
jgi:hypothetical protein